MTAYRSAVFRPARRYRSPYGRRGGSVHPAGVAAVLAVAALGFTQARGGHAPSAAHTADAVSRPVPAGAAMAVAYARARVGDPYLWGGTGPGAYDCSGLTMQAWASAGVPVERTAADQWFSEHRVTSPAAGDLVFFSGADGTFADPGHVGIVVDPAAHLMIDAYGTGHGVRYDTYGLASSAGGLTDPVGFTDPAEGSS